MNIIFMKGAGKTDPMQVFRPGLPVETVACPKQGIIPHDMVHYAVEHTLDAWLNLPRECGSERPRM